VIKTVETENEGLKRAFMLTIPAEDIDARVEQEVKRIAPQIRMPGFRPGKVPPNLIRKMHGESLQQDALNSAVQAGVDYYGPTDFLKINDDITTPPGCVLNHDAHNSFVGYLLAYDKPGQGVADLKKHLGDPAAPYPQLKHLVELLSPVTFVKPGLPPLFIGHGTKDLLVPLEQSKRLCEMLKQAGDRVELSISEGAPHGDLGPKTDKAAVLFFCDILNPAAKAQAEAMNFNPPRQTAAARKKN
jgi:acetyl esterase/lipase